MSSTPQISTAERLCDTFWLSADQALRACSPADRETRRICEVVKLIIALAFVLGSALMLSVGIYSGQAALWIPGLILSVISEGVCGATCRGSLIAEDMLVCCTCGEYQRTI